MTAGDSEALCKVMKPWYETWALEENIQGRNTFPETPVSASWLRV
jgi:hypothetical protein